FDAACGVAQDRLRRGDGVGGHGLGRQRPGAEEADHALAAAVGDVDLGQRVVADGVALVDVDPRRRVAGLDDAAEGGEGLLGEGFGGYLAHPGLSLPSLTLARLRGSLPSLPQPPKADASGSLSPNGRGFLGRASPAWICTPLEGLCRRGQGFILTG